ncbi:MAG: DNA helicase II [Gammaproteobacteria bacterium]|nr:DNA helicase II [Gammaproteobacteria bacterium]
MDVSYILNDLNDAQRQAVCSTERNLLILAGAGSGKTRVLVHRIAWLIQAENVSPFGILSVTFTNKAASEMRGRIESLLNTPTKGMWVGTFHGLAHRLLRTHWREANLPQNFQVIDSEDQHRAIKRIVRELELDDTQWQPKQVQWFINARKDEGQRPDNIEHHNDPYLEQLIVIYKAYETMCQRSGLVDFAELLLRAHELWLKQPTVLAHYQQRFSNVLVDEFQDTNAIQYAWLRMLVGTSGRIFVVGDDDQSIYGWRGARIEHIQKIQNDFPETGVVKLEQNYRSTGVILEAANALISVNTGRLGKNLWTDGKKGDPISLFSAFNEIDEARFVVNQIMKHVQEGGTRAETAILYRSNAQSRVFEEALFQLNIPYRVYGGLRFFERAEIKDALSYLRLIANRADDAAFERIVNTPTRGIGARSMEEVRMHARQYQISLWEASKAIVSDNRMSGRATNAIATFLTLIEQLSQETKERTLADKVEQTLKLSTLLHYHKNDKSEKAQTRLENLEELITAASHFRYEEGDEEPMDELSAFLSHAALEAGENQGDQWEDCVQLMTLHSAKGLEFPLVFLCGVEEGLFPHQRSTSDETKLEEERRLCYVGMTRAMKQLYFSHAQSRRLHGTDTYPSKSRFIEELPTELIQEVRLKGKVTQPTQHQSKKRTYASTKTSSYNGLRLGQRVSHGKFGEGVVLQFEGESNQARIQVQFDQAGSKWLVMSYANLQGV